MISPVVALLIVFKSLAASEPVSVIVTSFPPLIPLDAYAVFISAAIPVIVSTVDAFTDPGTLLSTTFNGRCNCCISESRYIITIKVHLISRSPLISYKRIDISCSSWGVATDVAVISPAVALLIVFSHLRQLSQYR